MFLDLFFSHAKCRETGLISIRVESFSRWNFGWMVETIFQDK